MQFNMGDARKRWDYLVAAVERIKGARLELNSSTKNSSLASPDPMLSGS